MKKTRRGFGGALVYVMDFILAIMDENGSTDFDTRERICTGIITLNHILIIGSFFFFVYHIIQSVSSIYNALKPDKKTRQVVPLSTSRNLDNTSSSPELQPRMKDKDISSVNIQDMTSRDNLLNGSNMGVSETSSPNLNPKTHSKNSFPFSKESIAKESPEQVVGSNEHIKNRIIRLRQMEE